MERQVKLTLSGCVVSIWCVGFASLDVVCDELNDCAWNVCFHQISPRCLTYFTTGHRGQLNTH